MNASWAFLEETTQGKVPKESNLPGKVDLVGKPKPKNFDLRAHICCFRTYY